MKNKITLREGIAVYWHYHIAINDIPLCGNKHMMNCKAPLDTWGQTSSHLIESYCGECEKIAKERGIL